MIGMSIDIVTQINEYMKPEMSQRELAQKLGKKESEISKWLSGSHNFTLKTIAKIEEVFGKKIILVPMFAAEDLGYKYEMKVTVSSISQDEDYRPLWSIGADYTDDKLVLHDAKSLKSTTLNAYGKAN